MNKITVLVVSLALASTGAWAASSTGTPAQPTPAEAPVSAEPQQTSASFGDWVVRCDTPKEGATRVCEVAQSLVIKGQQSPIAQIAFGNAVREKAGEPALMLTVLLPVSIAFDKAVRLGPGSGTEDAGGITLTFRRCLPGGCFADAKTDPSLMKTLRTATKPGHLTFADAAERVITLPVSFRGLPQALDQLAKEGGQTSGR